MFPYVDDQRVVFVVQPSATTSRHRPHTCTPGLRVRDSTCTRVSAPCHVVQCTTAAVPPWQYRTSQQVPEYLRVFNVRLLFIGRRSRVLYDRMMSARPWMSVLDYNSYFVHVFVSTILTDKLERVRNCIITRQRRI